MKASCYIFIALILLTLSAKSQNKILDSLKIELKNTDLKDDTSIISLHYEIASELINIGKYNDAIEKLDLTLLLSEKANYFIGATKAKYGRANIHVFNSENEQALAIYSEIEESLNNKDFTASEKDRFMSPIYSSMGNIYDYYSNYGKALEYHTKSMQLSKNLGNDINYAIGLGNIASIYQKTGDLDEAIEYHLKSIKIKEKENSAYSLGLSYYNLSQIYNKKKDYQAEIDMLKKSQDYAEKANDLIGIALCNISIGNTYLELADFDTDSLKNFSQKELSLLNKSAFLEKALQHESKAIELLESINEVHYIPHAYNCMGTVLGNQNKHQEAIKYYLKAYSISKGKNIDISKTSAEGMYEVYKNSKDFKNALIWHETFLKLKDSLNNENNQKEIGKRQAELTFIKTLEIEELKHQTEIEQLNFSNEKKQIIANNEHRKQQYIIWTIATGLVLISLFLVIMIRRWKITSAQKETINLQKEVIEKEMQTKEDSINYAKNIQKVAFPSLKHVTQLIPNHFILFKPKDIVSGDFYWASQVGNKKFIALADCTGHGVPGAFMTLISLNILNQIIADEISAPKDIMEQLHLRLQKRLSKTSKHGLDIAICMIEDNKLTFAGTHIPLYHIRSGRLEEFKGQRFQLGSSNSTLFQQHEILTQENDTFYISTDGFPDQKGGEKRKKYFYPVLRKKLTSIVKLDLDEQRTNLTKEFMEWKGSQEQLDDVSIIGFKI